MPNVTKLFSSLPLVYKASVYSESDMNTNKLKNSVLVRDEEFSTRPHSIIVHYLLGKKLVY